MKNLPIGILSGTFDPIHLGHVHLATTIHKLCNLQKILLIPCHQSPFKTQPIASSKDRLNMIELAIKNLPFLKTEDYEIKKPTISYTSNTLEYLAKKNEDSPLALIMGIDVFDRFDEWHKPQRILELAHLIVVGRKNHNQITNKKVLTMMSERKAIDPKQLQETKSGLIYPTDINSLPITATEIRALIKQKKEVDHLISKEILEYVKDNKLYVK